MKEAGHYLLDDQLHTGESPETSPSTRLIHHHHAACTEIQNCCLVKKKIFMFHYLSQEWEKNVKPHKPEDRTFTVGVAYKRTFPQDKIDHASTLLIYANFKKSYSHIYSASILV